jgi:hypothetical protein
MPYDEALVHRLRELLAGEEAVAEKRMFGGLAFLVGGHLAVAASHTGGLLARVDPDDADTALQRPHAAPMEMRGRTMPGWIMVGRDGLGDVARWVEQSLAYVRTLPPKT